MTIVEEPPPTNNLEPNIPETETPKIPEEEKDDIVIPECPSSKDQRIGDFRNEKLERVIGHKFDITRGITLYEDVPFKDQYIPSCPQFVGVFSLALVGASAPLVLQLVRPLVKQVITKLTKKKKRAKIVGINIADIFTSPLQAILKGLFFFLAFQFCVHEVKNLIIYVNFIPFTSSSILANKLSA